MLDSTKVVLFTQWYYAPPPQTFYYLDRKEFQRQPVFFLSHRTV